MISILLLHEIPSEFSSRVFKGMLLRVSADILTKISPRIIARISQAFSSWNFLIIALGSLPRIPCSNLSCNP